MTPTRAATALKSLIKNAGKLSVAPEFVAQLIEDLYGICPARMIDSHPKAPPLQLLADLRPPYNAEDVWLAARCCVEYLQHKDESVKILYNSMRNEIVKRTDNPLHNAWDGASTNGKILIVPCSVADAHAHVATAPKQIDGEDYLRLLDILPLVPPDSQLSVVLSATHLRQLQLWYSWKDSEVYIDGDNDERIVLYCNNAMLGVRAECVLCMSGGSTVERCTLPGRLPKVAYSCDSIQIWLYPQSQYVRWMELCREHDTVALLYSAE